MNRRPLEPLDSEERLLADQLARLGPHGEPSSALDARILAAAHDAVATRPSPRRKPRWPVAMGLAASALLAVGIAWQLRPVDEMRSAEQTALPEAARIGDDGSVADTATPARAPVQPRQETTPAPPAPARVMVPAPPAPTSTEPALARRAQAPARRHAAPEAATPAAAPTPSRADAFEYGARPAPASAPPAPAAPPPSSATVMANRASEAPLDALAVQSSAATADDLASTADRPGFVADPETTAAIAARREKARAEQARDAADAAEAARGGAEARTRSAAAKATPQPAPAPPALATSAPVAPAPASATRNALKRTDLQLPVIEDTKLPPEDWLERIRLRRDLGDRVSAADSLVRFKQSHPFQKVPDDLKELLGE